MDPARRQRYLQALGVRDFLGERRMAVAAAAPAVATPVPPAPSRPSPAAPAAAAPSFRTEVRAPAARHASPPTEAVEERPVEAPLPPLPSLDSLEAAQACVTDCTRCALHRTRTQTVFGIGASEAPLLVVGEGPGAEEDRRGEPFVGRAGQLLDAMLAAIGHDRARNTYIANVVKCRPPNNRDPLPEEVEACRPFLDAQIEALQPRLILAVGRVAAQRLLNTDEPLSRLRGRSHHYGPAAVPVWVSYHPAYLLRAPREKAKAWEDLKRVHALLNAADQSPKDGDGAGD
ncbi:uracil-DNA glycosylase [Algiphilus sp.]|uniref:uracil-DNA glycosylase n=2 Tax=Algiphilus sp. TaxID=1872431 RepID=UPI002A5F5E03|nr:uracil-DNA glycosylase [Pseudomonadota bacterium]